VKVVFVGAGRVATQLSQAMQKAGLSIVQVYSRSQDSARALAERLHTAWTTEVEHIRTDAHLLVFAVKDDALQGLVARVPTNEALWIHTAGSVPADVFAGYARRYGVLYPLQTFAKDRQADFARIPCFIEAGWPADEALLHKIAGQLSECVWTLDSARRKYLHLAAVFAGNFTNHMYLLAGKLLADHGLPAEVLWPLIDETAAKIHTLTPSEAQTGPAVRYDRNVINQHLALITDPAMREIYQLITINIHKRSLAYE
jgi:predicted short-subunit dehydrogenase-like oxidoreductase (DUF2520 family)